MHLSVGTILFTVHKAITVHKVPQSGQNIPTPSSCCPQLFQGEGTALHAPVCHFWGKARSQGGNSRNCQKLYGKTIEFLTIPSAALCHFWVFTGSDVMVHEMSQPSMFSPQNPYLSLTEIGDELWKKHAILQNRPVLQGDHWDQPFSPSCVVSGILQGLQAEL